MSKLGKPAHGRRRPGAVRVNEMLAANGRTAPGRHGLRIALLTGGGVAAVATVFAMAVSGPSTATPPATGGSGSTGTETSGTGPVTLSDVSGSSTPPSAPDSLPAPAAPAAGTATQPPPGTTARQAPAATGSPSTSRPAPRPAPGPAPDPAPPAAPAPEPAPEERDGVLDALRGLFP